MEEKEKRNDIQLLPLTETLLRASRTSEPSSRLHPGCCTTALFNCRLFLFLVQFVLFTDYEPRIRELFFSPPKTRGCVHDPTEALILEPISLEKYRWDEEQHADRTMFSATRDNFIIHSIF